MAELWNRRTPPSSATPGDGVFWAYFKPPFRFVEVGDTYYVEDSNATCRMRVMLMWPTHPPEETEAAEIETRRLGEVFAAAANEAHRNATAAIIGTQPQERAGSDAGAVSCTFAHPSDWPCAICRPQPASDASLPELPTPRALDWPGEGVTFELTAIGLWVAHGYDTGAEPLFTAEQMRAYASRALAESRAEARQREAAWHDLAQRAWQLLDVSEPNAEITGELFAALAPVAAQQQDSQPGEDT